MAASLEGLTLKVTPDTTTQEEILSRLLGKFLLIQSHYQGSRNPNLDNLRAFFRGNHWVEGAAETDEGEFRLVINYCRRVVLDFAGMLARAPIPRVPSPPAEDPVDNALLAARNREALLRLVWDDFLEAWRRAELNAAKLGYGVLQVLWKEDLGFSSQGEGDRRYTEVPFTFRSIMSEKFYPVYNTYDRSDDFLYVFRFDPGRTITELALKYDMLLQGTELSAEDAEPTADLIEYWDDKYYVLVARTIERVALPKQTGLWARFRQTQEPETVSHLAVLVAKEHKYGRIPFWVVQNIVNPELDPTADGSLSDIEDINVLNQHLNLMRSEQAEEIVTNIHRPLVYKSDDHQQEANLLSFSAGSVYPIGLDEELAPVVLQPQPEFIEAHMLAIEKSVRTMSFLGDAGFGDFAAGTSGVAARIALTPMQRILELKLPPRVYCLRSISSFVLKVFEDRMPKDVKLIGWLKTSGSRFGKQSIAAGDINGDYFVDVQYGNLLPRDDEAHQQNETYKYTLGIQSLWTTLDAMGITDPEAEIQRLRLEAKDPFINPKKFMETQQALQMQAEAMQQKKAPGAGVRPGAAPLETAPQVPPEGAFPRAPNAGGFGPGTLAPFLGRGAGAGDGEEMAGVGAGIQPGNVPLNPGGMG